MKTQERREIEFTVTFDLKEAEALLAFLRNDETVPWGISDGRVVANGLICELEKFIKG